MWKIEFINNSYINKCIKYREKYVNLNSKSQNFKFNYN